MIWLNGTEETQTTTSHRLGNFFLHHITLNILSILLTRSVNSKRKHRKVDTPNTTHFKYSCRISINIKHSQVNTKRKKKYV